MLIFVIFVEMEIVVVEIKMKIVNYYYFVLIDCQLVIIFIIFFEIWVDFVGCFIFRLFWGGGFLVVGYRILG